jgi:ABC-type transporter Mla maintaining outer membrane lipid asymmetry ATPase subunit MlaF
VAVSHESGSINTIADRAVMLAHGRVIAAGTLEEVRSETDPRVRAFFERALVAGEVRRTLGDELEWRA